MLRTIFRRRILSCDLLIPVVIRRTIRPSNFWRRRRVVSNALRLIFFAMADVGIAI